MHSMSSWFNKKFFSTNSYPSFTPPSNLFTINSLAKATAVFTATVGTMLFLKTNDLVVSMGSSELEDAGALSPYGFGIGKRSIPVLLGSEFRVNSYTANDQSRPAITALTDDSFVVVWESVGQDGDRLGIYGQRYGADSAVLGSEFRVNSYVTNDQRDAGVTAFSNGSFAVPSAA